MEGAEHGVHGFFVGRIGLELQQGDFRVHHAFAAFGDEVRQQITIGIVGQMIDEPASRHGGRRHGGRDGGRHDGHRGRGGHRRLDRRWHGSWCWWHVHLERRRRRGPTGHGNRCRAANRAGHRLGHRIGAHGGVSFAELHGIFDGLSHLGEGGRHVGSGAAHD